jgi:AcrR family transcriptional regulator/DNA-binding transcriptional ArsR family regulator
MLEPGTLAWRFLNALTDTTTVGSGELRERLGTDETQISRTGRRLREAGLAERRKVGRSVSWELTPVGRRALAQGPPRRGGAPADDEPGGAAWWRDVMRRAWVAPPGDEHEPSGDPERDRIVNAARQLHLRNGVLATTWPDIAELADVPVGAVSEHFPAVEDLVPACGGLSWRLLRFPPPEVAADLFAGEELDERMRLLVERIFDVYERAAPSLELLRREGPSLPVLARARDTLDAALDALIVAAAGDERAIPLTRELAGLSVWRALRDAGVEEPVEIVADALTAAVRAATQTRV